MFKKERIAPRRKDKGNNKKHVFKKREKMKTREKKTNQRRGTRRETKGGSEKVQKRETK